MQMTEAEWLECADPTPMLAFLRGKASDRKLRLFIADGVKSLESIFGDGQKRLAQMHEQVADGLATEEDLERFLLRGMPELWEHRAPGGNLPSIEQIARMVVRDRFKLAPLQKGERVTDEDRTTELAEMSLVLRDIFGNPFHPLPPVSPAVLAWNDDTVRRIAEGIYDERRMPGGTLDTARLAILADALLDAGCDDEDLIQHCRSETVHVRGCWALDLILGKD
jgi:hypothetical protein